MQDELGRSGLNRFGGTVSEEFLTELQGAKAIKVYREMSDNDSTVGAVLFAIKMLCRQVNWHIQAGAEDKAAQEAAAFIEECFDDMEQNFTDFLSEALSFLVYGWSLFELVYKRRTGNKKDARLKSKYTDGKIGWRKFASRAQTSLKEWQFDSQDNLTAFLQSPPPNYQTFTIPAEKFLLFRTETTKQNPEGRSLLRNCYRSWFFLKKIQELEGIGIERDLAGLPVLIAPEGLAIWSEENAGLLATCNEFISNIRRDAAEGLVLPYGWELKLLSAGTGSGRQFDTSAIINRYQQDIARSVLADFIFLGSANVGSWALSSDKTALFSVAIGTYLDIISEEINRKAIPTLMMLNKMTCATPKLIHGDIEKPNLKELGEYLKTCVGLSLIEPSEDLEDYLRDAASLPKKI